MKPPVSKDNLGYFRWSQIMMIGWSRKRLGSVNRKVVSIIVQLDIQKFCTLSLSCGQIILIARTCIPCLIKYWLEWRQYGCCECHIALAVLWSRQRKHYIDFQYLKARANTLLVMSQGIAYANCKDSLRCTCAVFSGSSSSGGAGALEVSTAQNLHPLVQVSPEMVQN